MTMSKGHGHRATELEFHMFDGSHRARRQMIKILEQFDMTHTECFSSHDKARMLEIIDASSDGLAGFNETVRAYRDEFDDAHTMSIWPAPQRLSVRVCRSLGGSSSRLVAPADLGSQRPGSGTQRSDDSGSARSPRALRRMTWGGSQRSQRGPAEVDESRSPGSLRAKEHFDVAVRVGRRHHTT